MKFEKISVSFEHVSRVKAENRARKVALLASMSDEEKRHWEEKSHEIAKDFHGYSSVRDPGKDG